MKKETVLSEIVIEMSYFLYLLRRTRVDSVTIPYNEVGSRLRNVVSSEVADFIGSSVNLLKQGGKFADYRVLFESKLLEYARNPDIRVDELKALHYSIAILEKCIRRDWDEFIEFTLLLLKNETWGSGGYEIPLRVKRVQRFLREKDKQNVTVEREEFERYKNEEWNRNPLMTDEEIQEVLSEGAKGRAATHEEMMLMSETLIAERAKNPSVTLKQVMKQLGLEDIGTHIDFDFDDQTS